MHDVIIVGAGPAGLTAAIYARRAEKSVLVIEAKGYGGQIINTPDIENYPVAPHISGFEFAQKLYDQAKALGAQIIFDTVTGLRENGQEKIVLTKKGEYACKAVILATGSENRKLGVEGEDRLIGKGVSYCATCDGAFYRKKTVAVVGGGNTALEDALYLCDLARTVYLIHRRDGFRGEEATVQRLKQKENLHFVLNSRVTALRENGRLTGVEVTDAEGKKSELALDGLFVAVGRVPENQNFASFVHLDETGYVVAGEDCRTNLPWIFTAGDNRVKAVRQLVTAAADGAVAATNAVQYLNGI